MNWEFYLILALMFLIGALVLAFIRSKMQYKSGRFFDPFNIMFIGVVLASVILFIPIYLKTFEGGECGPLETFLISFHNMIRLFVVDGDFDFITSHIVELEGWVYTAYTVLFSILFVVAPLMTFGFVLSFFRNLAAYRRYISHFYSDVYVFSELNEKSLMLADSLKKSDPRHRFFVFTDVFEVEEEENFELIERAKELGAIYFKKDIVTVNFSFHSRKKSLNFFTIGEDETENTNQSLTLFELYKHRDNTNLYVFSTQIEAEMLLANAFNQSAEDGKGVGIKVRRINEVQSLVLNNLYDNGHQAIFESAHTEEDGSKTISAVIIGMGRHGTTMAKALAWFGQMDGYRLHIHAFDVDPKAEDRFCSLCPELMDPQYNGHFEYEYDAKYSIQIHSGIDVTTKTFDDLVVSLPRATYIFVALGNDEADISTAVKLRMLFARSGRTPVIHSVVYNSEKAKALCGVSNHSKQAFDIDFIGDRRSCFSEKIILGTEIEKKALARHLLWGDENEFWQYDYNYNSSIASAIHKEMKIKCGISGIEKDPKDRTKEELWAIRILEHSRWNAYMRAEGYVFSGSIDKSTRNNLAKTHHLLVPFIDLPDKEKEKDDD